MSGQDDTCPRVLTRDQMIEGLKAGGTICVDRIDAPELPELRKLEQEGYVKSLMVYPDSQSSVLKFYWALSGTEQEAMELDLGKELET